MIMRLEANMNQSNETSRIRREQIVAGYNKKEQDKEAKEMEKERRRRRSREGEGEGANAGVPQVLFKYRVCSTTSLFKYTFAQVQV